MCHRKKMIKKATEHKNKLINLNKVNQSAISNTLTSHGPFT